MKYIVDDRGAKTSVVVPLKQWEKINTDYKRLQEKLRVFQSIKSGIKEIKESKLKGTK